MLWPRSIVVGDDGCADAVTTVDTMTFAVPDVPVPPFESVITILYVNVPDFDAVVVYVGDVAPDISTGVPVVVLYHWYVSDPDPGFVTVPVSDMVSVGSSFLGCWRYGYCWCWRYCD